ncbi:class I adenylate-forming enzyme family protein [Rhodococcus sp. SJ-3]|uniref:class I adenylate-forming enzyme family protein n=1 Tax=Rhodococcus sp. SJ-3 TaxID=3454628 RepID=UPI003F7A4B44
MMTRRPLGLPDSLTYPVTDAGALLAGTARRYPNNIAIRDGDLSLTYAELREQALRTAQGLRERGVEPGDVVAFCQPNSLWFTVTYYGTLLAGAVVAPLNPTLPPSVVRDQLEEVGAVAVIAHPLTTPLLRAADAATVRFVVAVPGRSTAPASDTAPAEDIVPLEDLLSAEPVEGPAVSPDAIAHLSFTGGTTGRSKAVQVLHRNLVANVCQMSSLRTGSVPDVDGHGGVFLKEVPGALTRYMSAPGTGCALSVAPLFHAMGLVSQNITVLTGGTVVMMGRFDAIEYLDLVEEHLVTQVSGSPAFFHLLLTTPGVADRDMSHVRSVTSGAAPIDTTTLTALKRIFPHAVVVEAYGLTEATMGLSSGLFDDSDTVPVGSVGVPVFDTEVELRDTADPNRVVPQGEVGELWARGPQITAGYLDHPELADEQFRDGWLLTGDLAQFDENGYLFIVGRAKDMLIYKGYNVYPGQLEEILAKHPLVAQASVIGVAAGDTGEIPVGYVVLVSGAAPSDRTATELIDYVAAHVAPYQKVREIHFLDALPTSAAGKILKAELRQQHHSVRS